MAPSLCLGYAAALLVAAVVLGPGLAVSPDEVKSLGKYGRDYEGNLCGVAGGARDLKRRAFIYYMQPHNLSSGVCLSACPYLRDDLVCDYTYAASEARRAQLGKRCFGQLRTRATFLTCLPTDPAAASTVDAWLSAHAWDQIGADTLQASGVIFGCWLGAGLAGYLCLLGLCYLPQTTVFTTLMLSLLLTPAYGALLLSHGAEGLGEARLPAAAGAALLTRERKAAQAALAAGWVAVLCGAVLLLSIALRARQAPLATGVLEAAAHAVRALPASLLLLPLWASVAAGGALSAWLGSVAYYAAPPGAPGALWAWSALPLAWLLQLLVAWEWSVVSAAVGAWYSQLSARRRGGGRGVRLAMWRCVCRALAPAHVDSLAAAAALLPLAGVVAVVLPSPGAQPRRDANPVSRLALAAAQRSLRAARAVCDVLHPAAIVQLQLTALRPLLELGGLKGAGAAEAEEPGAGHWAHGADGKAAEEAATSADADAEGSGLLGAGHRTAALYAATPARLQSARAHAHFFLELAKGTIAAASALVGWLWLTDAGAAPVLTTLWPLLLMLLGSHALASTAIAICQATVETVIQCYCEECKDLLQARRRQQAVTKA